MRMLIHLRELLPNSESLMATLYFAATRRNGSALTVTKENAQRTAEQRYTWISMHKRRKLPKQFRYNVNFLYCYGYTDYQTDISRYPTVFYRDIVIRSQ